MNTEKRAVTRTRVELTDFMYFCPKEVSEALLARELITRDLYRKAFSTDNPTSIVGKIVSCLCDRVGLNPGALVDIVEVLLQIQGSDAVVKKLKDNYAQYGGTLALPSSAASTVEVSRPDYGLTVMRQEEKGVTGQELTVQNIMRFLKERDFPAGNARKLSIGLGLPSGKVDQLKRENPDLEEMLMAVIDHWLRNDSDKSWDKLAESLRYHCDCANLADEIQGKESLRRRAVTKPEPPAEEEPTDGEESRNAADSKHKPLVVPSEEEQRNPAVSSNKLPTPVQVSEESRDAAGVLLLNKLRKEDVVQEVAKETNHTAMNYVRKVVTVNQQHILATVVAVAALMLIIRYLGSSTEGCHLIENSKSLEDEVLLKLGGDLKKTCSRLELENCKELEQEKKLSSFNLAESYIRQHEKPCWEKIVAMLCGLKERQLARIVADGHNVEYELNCPK